MSHSVSIRTVRIKVYAPAELVSVERGRVHSSKSRGTLGCRRRRLKKFRLIREHEIHEHGAERVGFAWLGVGGGKGVCDAEEIVEPFTRN